MSYPLKGVLFYTKEEKYMKYNYSKAVMAGVLVMALATGGTVIADTVRAEQNTEIGGSLVTMDDGNTEGTGNDSLQPADQVQQPSGEETADNSAALNEALQALETARKDERIQKLEEELKEYVEAGTLTQAQADLILEQAKEHQTRGLNRNNENGSVRNQMTDPSSENRKGKKQGMQGQPSQLPQNGQQGRLQQSQQPQSGQPEMHIVSILGNATEMDLA